MIAACDFEPARPRIVLPPGFFAMLRAKVGDGRVVRRVALEGDRSVDPFDAVVLQMMLVLRFQTSRIASFIGSAGAEFPRPHKCLRACNSLGLPLMFQPRRMRQRTITLPANVFLSVPGLLPFCCVHGEADQQPPAWSPSLIEHSPFDHLFRLPFYLTVTIFSRNNTGSLQRRPSNLV